MNGHTSGVRLFGSDETNAGRRERRWRMRVVECQRVLRKFYRPNCRQRECQRLQNDRRQKTRVRCRHGTQRRGLNLVGWRTAGVDRATSCTGNGRTFTRHLASRGYCQQRLRSGRNCQQQDYQRVFHESRTHNSITIVGGESALFAGLNDGGQNSAPAFPIRAATSCALTRV